jgi:hypothetical protein
MKESDVMRLLYASNLYNLRFSPWHHVIKTKLKGLNFPKEMRNLIAEKREFRRKWHQSRYPHDKILLNRVSQQLSKELKTIKQSSINKFLTELTQDSSTKYSLRKATKYLK